MTTDRAAGGTRYGTAAAVATEAYPNGNDTVVIATGENFPDALAASGLAGDLDAPILLVQRDSVTEDTIAAIEDLGATTGVVVGGTAAVSDAVVDALEDEGLTVTREAGTNRYETAAAVADAIGDYDTAIVASGEVAADALSAGSIAADIPAPILLVTQNDVPAATAGALEGVGEVIIAGGTARISDATADEVEAASDDTDAERVAGINRQETAAALAEWAVENLGWDPDTALLAAPRSPSQDFSPDALVAGPLGGLRDAPILIIEDVDSLGAAAEGFLEDHADTIAEIIAVGGTAVIADSVLEAAEAAAETGQSNPDTTTRPELVSARIVETRTATNATLARPQGTYVLFDFDEQVTGVAPTAAQFFVYDSTGLPYAGDVATVQQGDTSTVEVRFNALNTTTLAGGLTLAAVNDGAVQGQAGASDTNIEGDAPLTPASTAAAAAGVTSTPDLVSVGNFRVGVDNDNTAVDFTFDSAAFNQNPAGYHLVRTTGEVVDCTGPASGSTTVSGGTVVGGEGTTVHTVLCPELPLGPPWSTTTIVRGYVDAGTVDSTDVGAAPMNPLQAADVSNSGNSDGPDLVAVVFSPDAVPNADIVAFLYDEPVSSTVTPGGHAIYDTTGAENNVALCSRNGENNAVVTCAYGDNTLSGAAYVGGNVVAGTVTDLQAIANEGDEVGTTPSATAAATAGKTAGPDLTGVTINAVTSPFGNTTHTVTYTFDEDTADDEAGAQAGDPEQVILAGLHLYTPDGIRLDCAALSSVQTADQALAGRAEDADNTITCTSFVVGGTATPATDAQVANAAVGTVDQGSVADEEAANGVNPIGAEPAKDAA